MATRGKRLLEVVLETLERGGNVVIPAFAVGRTQEILYELNLYVEKGALKGVKCYVDSPTAISAGEIYSRHPECFDHETLSMRKRGDSPFESSQDCVTPDPGKNRRPLKIKESRIS